jgi:miniconductance mechanosensitive channel
MLFSNDPAVWLRELLIGAGLSFKAASVLSATGLALVVLFLSWLSNLIARVIIRTFITRLVRKTASVWDDIFLEQKVFTRLSHFIPAMVIWFMAGWILKEYPLLMIGVRKFTYMYMLAVGMVVMNSFVESWYRVYLTLPVSEHRSIKGYVQIVKLIIIIFFGLLIVSVVFSQRVTTIIAGLGVMASVLMLIFKDAILGLVASIQLSANNMVKIGDWITIPSRDVDGEVIDITLTTVKVKNFDKTIITVPVYALVNESFQNWVGMVESGVRQIKREFRIDANSIRFADDDLKLKIAALPLLNGYFNQSGTDGPITIKSRKDDKPQYFSSDRITNLGYFRLYAVAYLRNHPEIDKRQIVIVRHKQPEGDGIRIQVCAFAGRTDFETYENLQSEIFEHLITMTSQFGLKVFQHPAGSDILALSKTK